MKAIITLLDDFFFLINAMEKIVPAKFKLNLRAIHIRVMSVMDLDKSSGGLHIGVKGIIVHVVL